MRTHTVTRKDGTITVSPKNEATQSALMVICHGLGDSAEGFADVAEVRTSTIRPRSHRRDILLRLLVQVSPTRMYEDKDAF